MIVVDSSAIVDYLLEFEPRAAQVARRLEEAPTLHAPHALDVEVLATLRRDVLGQRLALSRARLALDDFQALHMRRYPHTPFLERVWQLRGNLSVPDALFVALAEALDAPLVTTDRRIAGAPGHSARIEVLE